MLRRNARADPNQKEIVKALRDIGASVTHLHMVGRGCPDILVGFRGRNTLMEIKTKKGKLNKRQREFFDEWRGECWVVRTIDAALEAIGAI
jgi:hypothetical protein